MTVIGFRAEQKAGNSSLAVELLAFKKKPLCSVSVYSILKSFSLTSVFHGAMLIFHLHQPGYNTYLILNLSCKFRLQILRNGTNIRLSFLPYLRYNWIHSTVNRACTSQHINRDVRFQVSAEKQMSTVLFWNIMKPIMLIHCRVSEQPIGSTFKIEPLGCPEMSVRNYHYTMRINPEEHIFHT
jgi:hypothetical protein